MEMRKNGAMLTAACVMLCLTFNYTFPLRRESSKWNILAFRNDSQHYCDQKHVENIVDPTTKLSAHPHYEKALKIIKDVSNINKNRKSKNQAKCPQPKTMDDDLRFFEQMVIKKKNPYLDLKELELQFYNPKNTRQSVDPGSIVQDPSLCEALEYGPNVEITNRGLSGFAIPSKLLKGANDDTKTKSENPINDDSTMKAVAKVSKIQSDHLNHDPQLLKTLVDDIRLFEEST